MLFDFIVFHDFYYYRCGVARQGWLLKSEWGRVPERDMWSLGVMGMGAGGLGKFFRRRRRRRRPPQKYVLGENLWNMSKFKKSAWKFLDGVENAILNSLTAHSSSKLIENI